MRGGFAAVVIVSFALAACSSSSTATTTTTVVTPKGEHANQAAANAALLPLADLPAGTTSPQPPAKPSNLSCTRKPLVTKPRFLAVAIYQLPRSSTRLGDLVNIYAPGGAAQTMRNVREQWNCPVAIDPPDRQWSVAKLNFRSIAPGQLSYGFQHSYASQPNVTTTITDDVLLLPVNSSSVLELSASTTSTNRPGVDLSAFENFARKAWTRAQSALGR